MQMVHLVDPALLGHPRFQRYQKFRWLLELQLHLVRLGLQKFQKFLLHLEHLVHHLFPQHLVHP